MAKLPKSNDQKLAGPVAAAAGPGRQLKEQLKAGAVLIGGIGTEYLRPSLVKLYKQAGFDFLYIEYEHCFFSMTTLADTVLCARYWHSAKNIMCHSVPQPLVQPRRSNWWRSVRSFSRPVTSWL